MDLNKLWNFIRKRDGENLGEESNLPLLHEVIDLKSFDNKNFHQWAEGSVPKRIKAIIYAAYRQYQIHDPLSKSITFNETPQYSGIHLNCKKLDFENIDYKYFQVLIAQQIMTMNYKKSLAEARSERKNNNISTFHNIYLKPNLFRATKSEDGKMPQYFGNILIKFEMVNEEPTQFTITLNRYSDFKYQDAEAFETFVETIFLKK